MIKTLYRFQAAGLLLGKYSVNSVMTQVFLQIKGTLFPGGKLMQA